MRGLFGPAASRGAVALDLAVYACCPSCSQMLIFLVSGIRNRLRMKHTAGTAIG
jgi:hypothetical protein